MNRPAALLPHLDNENRSNAMNDNDGLAVLKGGWSNMLSRRALRPWESSASIHDADNAGGGCHVNRRKIPPQLDMHYITSNLLALSAPHSTVAASSGTSALDVASFMSDQSLLFCLGEDLLPDERTLVLVRRQVVCLPWHVVGGATNVPTLATILNVCYTLHAWLQNDVAHTALVYCRNGKTRTALAIACYLLFSQQVATAQQGFAYFVQARCGGTASAATLPASIRTFFSLVQDCFTYGRCKNEKPLLLRALALQGVPLEQAPVLDLYNAQGQLVYSSAHAAAGATEQSERTATTQDSTSHDDDSSRVALPPPALSSHWVEEEGFFRTHVILQGDFLLVCRFGSTRDGSSSDHSSSSSTSPESSVIFRYVNHTGAMAAGITYELPMHQVDLMPRYAEQLSHDHGEHDFLLSLVLDAHFTCTDPAEIALLRQRCDESVVPVVHLDQDAIHEGWRLIHEHHAAQPTPADVQQFCLAQRGNDQWSAEAIALALQLSNFHSEKAHQVLVSNATQWCRPETSVAVTTAAPLQYRSMISSMQPGDVARALGQMARSSSNMWPSPPSPGRPRVPLCHAASRLPNPANAEDLKLYNAHHALAVSLLKRLDHPGIFLQDILNLQTLGLRDLPRISAEAAEDAHQSNENSVISSPVEPASDNVHPPLLVDPESLQQQQQQQRGGGGTSAVGEESNVLTGGATEATSLDTPLKNGVHGKYFVMLSKGLSREAVEEAMKRDGQLDFSILDLDPQQSLQSQRAHSGACNVVESLPLKNDPTYSKYFSMLKMGLPRGAVENAMQRDGRSDFEVLDLDPERSWQSQQNLPEASAPVEAPCLAEPLLKSDPLFAKYFSMLKMGLPRGAVENAMQRDGRSDFNVLDLDPDQSWQSQQSSQEAPVDASCADEPPLKSDSTFGKYFSMLKMGLPRGAVENAMQRDGRSDFNVLDLDPERSWQSQQNLQSLSAQVDTSRPDESPLKSDSTYGKYFSMLKMGLPRGAVENAMQRDGRSDFNVLDLDPERSWQSQQRAPAAVSIEQHPPLRDDPEYSKYFKMLTMGLPRGAVENSMIRDGKQDLSVLELDPAKSLLSQRGEASNQQELPPLKDHAVYGKYFRMLALGLAKGAAQNAMIRDGKTEVDVLDLDPEKSLEAQRPQQKAPSVDADDKPPLKDDPAFIKYFRMLQAGLPKGAVSNAMQRDGKDTSIVSTTNHSTCNQCLCN
jgi:Subunit CCDC53 of WASH complex